MDITIPVTRSIKEARQVMLETSQLLKEDARRGHKAVIARAAGRGTKPPTPTRLFLDHVIQFQEDDDASLPEAIRKAAISQPTLHAAWLAEQRKKQENERQKKKEEAAHFRRRNDN